MKRLLLGFLLPSVVLVIASTAPAQSNAQELVAENAVATRPNPPDERALPPTDAQNAADEELADRVWRSILQDNLLGSRARDVKVVVEDGLVTLSGIVDTPQQKERTVARAEMVAGEGHVTDAIELAPLRPHRPYSSGRWP